MPRVMPSSLERYLANGVPVILWLGMWGDQSHYEYADDGTAYKINPGYHVVVSYGYDESGVYAADPATGSTVSWSWGDFMWMWNAMDGMSLAVWPLARAEAMATDPPAELTASDSHLRRLLLSLSHRRSSRVAVTARVGTERPTTSSSSRSRLARSTTPEM